MKIPESQLLGGACSAQQLRHAAVSGVRWRIWGIFTSFNSLKCFSLVTKTSVYGMEWARSDPSGKNQS